MWLPASRPSGERETKGKDLEGWPRNREEGERERGGNERTKIYQLFNTGVQNFLYFTVGGGEKKRGRGERESDVEVKKFPRVKK